ncbi:hypothetical protein [Nocardia aurea]|uniref:hypothetical protein n=1 Tax=Nocardia aurea TaxID=2144174 RepID=UPI0033A5B96B
MSLLSPHQAKQDSKAKWTHPPGTGHKSCHEPIDGECLNYEIVVRDSNLLLRIGLTIEVGKGRAINDSEAGEVTHVYVERVMTSLRR